MLTVYLCRELCIDKAWGIFGILRHNSPILTVILMQPAHSVLFGEGTEI